MALRPAVAWEGWIEEATVLAEAQVPSGPVAMVKRPPGEPK